VRIVLGRGGERMAHDLGEHFHAATIHDPLRCKRVTRALAEMKLSRSVSCLIPVEQAREHIPSAFASVGLFDHCGDERTKQVHWVRAHRFSEGVVESQATSAVRENLHSPPSFRSGSFPTSASSITVSVLI